MPTPVQIAFALHGMQDVARGFDTIEKSMIRLERAGARAANDGASERVTVAKREAGERVKTAEATTAKLDAIRGKQYAEAVRYIEKTERAEKAAADRLVADAERAEKRKTALVERENAIRARAVESAHKKMASVYGGAAMHGVSNALGTMASVGSMAFGVGGAMLMSDAVSGGFAAQRSAAQLVNAVTSGGTAPSGATVANILSQASATSIATGMDKKDVVEGTLAYSRSARGGDFKGAMDNMEFFAKLAKTTGTSITDIGSAAGTLQSQNANLDSAGMQKMLLAAYAQTKSGSVSLTEAAKQFGTLGSTRGLYQGDEADNQRKLLGLGQIAASGGAAGDIGTYIKDVSLEAAAHRTTTSKAAMLGGRGLESLGVHFDKFGAMESPEQMIGAVFKATGGDLGKIHGIFGNRGLPLFTELQKSFQGAGGGDAGVAAVQAQIAGVTGSAMSGKDLDAQFGQVMSNSAEKFSAATNRVKEKLEEDMAPAIDELANKLPKLLPKIEDIIDAGGKLAAWFLDNPIEGIGAIILASVAKDVASAAIGQGIKAVILAAMGGGGGTAGSAAGAGVGLVGKLGAGAGAAGAGLLATGAGVLASAIGGGLVGRHLALAAGEGEAAAGAANTLGTTGDIGRRKTMSASDIRARLGQLAEQRGHIGNEGYTEGLGGGIRALGRAFGGQETRDNVARDQAEQLKQNTEATRALTEELKARKGAQVVTSTAGSLTGPGHPAPVDPARGTNIGGR